LYNAGARRPSQAPRGPASHGGAYGSGYGDPFGGGFGTPRARSGWSNFRYQQRQYSRHGVGRAVVRSSTVMHCTVGETPAHFGVRASPTTRPCRQACRIAARQRQADVQRGA
jgi:hypothetical protein